jgi:hypothetical protein
MSHTCPATTSSSNFQLIINHALKAYEKCTKNELLTHPLAAQLQACDSPTSVLTVLQQKVQEHDQSRSRHETLTGWLGSTVNVLLCAFCNVWLWAPGHFVLKSSRKF